MRKLLPLLLFAWALSFTCAAQQAADPDVVYLKNGSVVRGTLLERGAGQLIRLRVADGSVFTYPLADVEKVTKAAAAVDQAPSGPAAKAAAPHRPAAPPRSLPFLTIAELGAGGKVGGAGSAIGQKLTLLTVSVVNGVQLGPHASAGLGLEIAYLTQTQSALIPIFLDARYYPLRGPVTPVALFDFGYGCTAAPGRLSGGLFLNPGLGLKTTIHEQTALQLSVNYRLHSEEFTYYKTVVTTGGLSHRSYTERSFVRFLSVRMGISF